MLTYGIQAMPEEAFTGDKQSSGYAEKAVQDLEMLLRVYILSLTRSLGHRIPTDHAVMGWLARHTSDMLNKVQRGHDGKKHHGKG